jgi:PleD family two-component response regulator
MKNKPLSFRQANARILIVDDLDFNVKLIATIFKNAGFKYIEYAQDGEEAVKKTHEFLPNLVIADVQMPKMDGFEYCRIIREDKNFDKMPIIFQTIDMDRELKLKALACGVDDFVNKPLDKDELLLRSMIHLNRHFMIEDLLNVTDYLTHEMKTANELLQQISDSSAPATAARNLKNHFECMEFMIENLPSATSKPAN